MPKPRVAVITPGVFEVFSETSSSVELVTRQVCRELKDDVEFVVFGRRLPGYKSGERRDGLAIIRFPRFSATRSRAYRHGRIGYLQRVSERLARLRPDIIQVENRPRFALSLKRRFPRTPVWLSLHSTTFISRPHIDRQLLRQCLTAVDRVIVNSSFLREVMLRIDPRCAAKTEVNYLGVDTETFVSRWEEPQRRKRAEMLESLGLRDKKIVLYAGRLLPIKGVHHLLRAMPSVADRFPETVLLVVGSAFYGSKKKTPYVSRLYRMGKALPRHVRFVPFVPHRDMHSWFALADVVVVPSFRKEAFGLVNVEAMSCGVPIIATYSGGMKEILRHGESGFLLDPQRIDQELPHYLQVLLADPALCRRMGEANARMARERFAWRETAKRLLRWYRETAVGGTNG